MSFCTSWNTEEAAGNLHGHSMQDAIQLLHSELSDVLKRHEADLRHQHWWHRFSFLRRNDMRSVLHWSNTLLLVLLAVLLMFAYSVHEPGERDVWLVIEAVVLLVMLGANFVFSTLDHQLRSREHISKAYRVLNILKDNVEPDWWEVRNFLDVHSPLSPCVSVQWTVRNGHIINLPCALLVEGDVILLRPGQTVPALCSAMLIDECMDEGEQTMCEGERYKPHMTATTSGSQESIKTGLPGQTKPISALRPKPFLVKETPFVRYLRSFLVSSLNKPVSSLNIEKYNLYSGFIEKWIIPIAFVVGMIINSVRYILVREMTGHWTDLFIVQQVQIVLPLSILHLSMLWKVLDAYGLAKLLAIFKYYQETEHIEESSNFSSDSMIGSYESTYNPGIQQILSEMSPILLGTSSCLPRSVNVLHVLGNITSICCVDKKGILSWPNPTAEKVFFLTQSDPVTGVGKKDSGSEVYIPNTDNTDNTTALDTLTNLGHPVTGFQVLDLTQDPKSAYGLQFDDPTWKKYISSLKPLGLDILLNTCNIETTDKYTQFGDHVTCASIKQEIQVPVVNRRCFCELSRQIGFGDQASAIFNTDLTMGMYRHIPEECDWKGKLMRTPGVQYKMPMPNMFSVVVTDSTSETQQLFSQGTADLLLDACTDFWDGYDIVSLSQDERRRILDFYHRTSMSSYCTAFAYRPLTALLSTSMKDIYLEVGEEAHKFHPMAFSPSRSRSCKSLDTRSVEAGFDSNLSAPYYGSVDSLLNANSSQTVDDMPGYLASQCGQIFVGMITMQYQAKQDIVSTIEDLEASCIRFVHFSKENELRSRVFSEKMGLEAGWNCHISLLSEADERGGESCAPSHTDWHPSGDSSATHHASQESVDQHTQSGSHHRLSTDASRAERRKSAPGGLSLNSSLAKAASQRSSVCTQEMGTTEEDGGQSVHDPLLGANAKNKDHYVASHEESNGFCLSNSLLDKSSSHSRSRTPGADAELAIDKAHSSIESEHGSCFFTDNSDSMAGYSNREQHDMSFAVGNEKAKLPKGIENIRSHIENVDNVPLQVSLFTDCTPQNTTQMLAILQDYGEVVCCIGSTANILNTRMFLQADASVGLEPMYPQICMKQGTSVVAWEDSDNGTRGPMEISSLLQTLPCSFIVKKANCIMPLIAAARHHCQQVRNSFLLLLMCQLSISLLQVLGALVSLPPLFSPHLLLWMAAIVVPLLCVSLMFTPPTSQIAYSAHSPKTTAINKQVALQFTVYYALRFLPTLAVCLLCHGVNLNTFCHKFTSGTNTTCHILLGNTGHNSSFTWAGWNEEYKLGLTFSQHILAFQLLLCYICSSMCYMYRSDHIWRRFTHGNTVWCCVSVFLLLLQLAYFALDIHHTTTWAPVTLTLHLSDTPIVTLVLTAVWPLMLIASHELIKHFEIKAWVRYQKRARLDFDTKLGMNSPF